MNDHPNSNIVLSCRGCGAQLSEHFQKYIDNPNANEWTRKGFCSFVCFFKKHSIKESKGTEFKEIADHHKSSALGQALSSLLKKIISNFYRSLNLKNLRNDLDLKSVTKTLSIVIVLLLFIRNGAKGCTKEAGIQFAERTTINVAREVAEKEGVQLAERVAVNVAQEATKEGGAELTERAGAKAVSSSVREAAEIEIKQNSKDLLKDIGSNFLEESGENAIVDEFTKHLKTQQRLQTPRSNFSISYISALAEDAVRDAIVSIYNANGNLILYPDSFWDALEKKQRVAFKEFIFDIYQSISTATFNAKEAAKETVVSKFTLEPQLTYSFDQNNGKFRCTRKITTENAKIIIDANLYKIVDGALRVGCGNCATDKDFVSEVVETIYREAN